jgi:hypothetical protein
MNDTKVQPRKNAREEALIVKLDGVAKTIYFSEAVIDQDLEFIDPQGDRINHHRRSRSMIFADGFWEVRNLVDVVTVIGLIFTLLSIWFSWILARRDLEQRLSVERQKTVERITLLLLRTDLSRVYWLLREARQSYQAMDFSRTLDRCEWAEYFLSQLPTTEIREAQDLLGQAEDDIRLVVKYIRAQARKPEKRDEVSEIQVNRLTQALTRLSRFERIIENYLLGGRDVRTEH